MAESPRYGGARRTIISRMAQFQSKPGSVSIMPYAPERLSISQDVLAPSMAQALTTANVPRERLASVSALKEDSPNTLFAALRVRRALQRSKGARETEPKVVKEEVQAIIARHQNVLSRYKIRKVSMEVVDGDEMRNLPPFMVNPHGNLYKLWQLVTLIFIIYQSLALPFTLAFGSSSSDSNWLDICMNSVFGFDIVIQFNTPSQSIIEGAEEYTTDRLKIAKKYAKGWLFFDVLACVPFDSVMVWINNVDSKGGNLNVLGLLKALRIPRLLRLVRLLRFMKLLKLRPELQRWLQYSRHANLFRLVRLVASFFVINHYLACVWYGLVASDATKAEDTSEKTSHLYFASLYTCLLVVMGQNITIYDDSEYVFCILCMVIGAVLMAVVFGNVAILIANYYENHSSYQKKMEWLFASMNRMKLPLELQNRINDYYQAMWERHGTLDGAVAAFIPELSRNLAYEVELFLRMDMINRAPIFQNCSAKVVQELVMELELQVFMPGDYVVVRGEVGNDMYFVQSGLCEVTKEVGVNMDQSVTNLPSTAQPSGSANDSSNMSVEVVLKSLGQGDYFGEIALLMNCKRTANVRAQVFSELCALTREVFENISLRYLEDRSIIEKFIMDKYDPGMLQAAMKQSHEVSMRTAAVASSVAMKRVPVPDPQSEETNISSTKLNGLLTKIYDRIVKLEEQINSDAEERRNSDLRVRINSAVNPHISHHTAASETVAFEPERVSQRDLFAMAQPKPASATPRGNPNASMLPRHPTPRVRPDKSTGGLPGTVQPTANHESNGIADDIDGVATPQDPNEKVWKRPPMLKQQGSWRNAHRDGSAESVRIRGISRQASSSRNGSIAHHSSRAASLTAAIAATEAMPVRHSLLQNEPDARSRLPSLEQHREQKEEITNAMLDELADRLALQQ